jgi:site-specific DNA-methyltransferase (adenine-specific)
MNDVQVLHGDALELLPTLDAASVDAVVTDPPYGLEFMGREWDGPKNWTSRDPGEHARPEFRGQTASPYLAARLEAYRAGAGYQQWCEQWAVECLRVLKPGGYLLAFGGTRTHHRLACAIEDAGFEIRDSIAWLYGSGFPKSLNLGDGRGTALKPAHEPIVVARKPLAGTVAANVLEHGAGALNIDGARVGTGEDKGVWPITKRRHADVAYTLQPTETDTTTGRWPPNVVLDEAAAAELDRQSGTSKDGVAVRRNGVKAGMYGPDLAPGSSDLGYGGEGGASRFFPTFRYEPKAPADERPRVNGVAHPTVKALDLMRWLVRLVTPPGGLVLDPFAGSGTTGEACIIEGFQCVLIEREADYLPLIKARLDKPIQMTLNGGAA